MPLNIKELLSVIKAGTGPSDPVQFKDLGLGSFLDGLVTLDKTRLNVGVFGAKAAETASSGKLTVGEAAIINEYGAKNIPARPFVGTLSQADALRMGKAVTKAIVNFEDPIPELDKIGAELAEKVRDRLKFTQYEPNAPSTIRKKGFDDPLIHTRKMLDAIDYQTVREDGSKVDGGADVDAYEAYEVT